MSNARATYTGEEVEVTFTANAVDNWIGDPNVINGTMDVISFEDIDVDSVTILGVDLVYKELPAALQAAILALADDLEFSVDEPDYDYDYY